MFQGKYEVEVCIQFFLHNDCSPCFSSLLPPYLLMQTCRSVDSSTFIWLIISTGAGQSRVTSIYLNPELPIEKHPLPSSYKGVKSISRWFPQWPLERSLTAVPFT